MRFRHPDGSDVHLAYCTNVHAAEDLDGVIAQLARYGEPIRARLGEPRLGLGLWLASPVAAALVSSPAAIARLRRELELRGLEVVTLNAFPYAGFHATSVKKAVYQPDWADPARLRYTLDCARVLAMLMPSDAARGSISTLPLAWREPWPPGRSDGARRQLDTLATELSRLAGQTGRRIRVGLEPEPGCVIENTAQAASLLRQLDPEWIGICLDTCHLAVAMEDPAQALGALRAAGVPVIKAQASCAVHAEQPRSPAVSAALREFAEPRFLHQTREAGPHGLLGADDLADALAGALPGTSPWRVHFHVPLHAELEAPLRSTRPELRAALGALLGGPSASTDHVEAETYTWSRLPGGRGDEEIVAGIAAELAWLRDVLSELGLARLQLARQQP
jgi:sugar phosphate isomerase/epimerase